MTLNSPSDWGVHDRVEEPLPVTLLGDREQLMPAGTEVERPTVPVKPFRGVTEILEVPVVPTFVPTIDGLAVRL